MWPPHGMFLQSISSLSDSRLKNMFCKNNRRKRAAKSHEKHLLVNGICKSVCFSISDLRFSFTKYLMAFFLSWRNFQKGGSSQTNHCAVQKPLRIKSEVDSSRTRWGGVKRVYDRIDTDLTIKTNTRHQEAASPFHPSRPFWSGA